MTSQLQRYLEQAKKMKPKVFLVDYFDTLVTRTVQPEYVKKIAARELSERLDFLVSPSDIYNLRAHIEWTLCQKNQEVHGYLDFNLREMGISLHNELRQKNIEHPLLSTEDDFANLVVSLEASLEKKVQLLSTETKGFLEEVKSQGAKLYLVSDIYLPKQVMEELLQHHNVRHLFEEIFISNEEGATKREGSLYDKILSRLGVKPPQAIMLGDNALADKEQAENKGITGFHLDRSLQHKSYAGFEAKRKSFSAFTNQLDKKLNSKFPFEPFRPLAGTLFLFIHKLYKETTKNSIQDLFFLSREGYLLKELFDLYVSYQHSPKPVTRSHYLMASRRSTFLPSLRPLEEEDFSTLLKQYQDLSLNDFLWNLGVTAESSHHILTELDLDGSEIITNFSQSSALKVLKRNETFQNQYESQRTEQKSLFTRYLTDFVEEDLPKKIHLVDIGWKGTIQDHISKILHGSCEVQSYYLGLETSRDQTPGDRKKGLIFTDYPRKSAYHDIFDTNRALYETLISASHGSPDSYKLDGDKVQPHLSQPTNRECTAHRQLQAIQRNLVSVFELYCQEFGYSHFSPSLHERYFAKAHARMVFFPSSQEISLFRSLQHKENFGQEQTTVFSSSEPPGLTRRFKNLIQLGLHPRSALSKGWWGPVTLHNMGLEALSPVYGSYRWIRDVGWKG